MRETNFQVKSRSPGDMATLSRLLDERVQP
jgi:hypothetical protein